MTQPQAPRLRRWTPERLARLDWLLDTGITERQAARRFNATIEAIRNTRRTYRIDAASDRFLSATEVARRLGLSYHAPVVEWLRAGYLAGKQWPWGCRGGSRWVVTEADLLTFLADPAHWHRWDERRLVDAALREWATDLRGGVYLTVKEVARRYGVTAETVRQWIASGQLPALRMRPTRQGLMLVKAVWLDGFVPVAGWRRRFAWTATIALADADAIYADWLTGRLSPAGLAFWWGVNERDVRRLIAERERSEAA